VCHQRISTAAHSCQLTDIPGLDKLLSPVLAAVAKVLRPLTDAVKGGQNIQLNWLQAMLDAFAASKAAITTTAELAHPDPDSEIFLGGPLWHTCESGPAAMSTWPVS
jgi:hypothetical protein